MTMSNQQDLELLAEARRYYGDAVHYDDGVFSVQTGKGSAFACDAAMLRAMLFDIATPKAAVVNNSTH